MELLELLCATFTLKVAHASTGVVLSIGFVFRADADSVYRQSTRSAFSLLLTDYPCNKLKVILYKERQEVFDYPIKKLLVIFSKN